MFDIKEYFENDNRLRELRHDIVNIDDDITHDITALLSSRFDSLYRRDRYKNQDRAIEIIYPALQYPGTNMLIMNPDRVRYLLSFYPYRDDLDNIDKIVLRPRFIEIGNIELVSLYLRRKKILVLYLFHPHFYRIRDAEAAAPDDQDGGIEPLLTGKLTEDTVRPDDGSGVHVHPLWHLLSCVRHGGDDLIDKFFIKKDSVNDRIYEILNDISFYYSRHGY